MVHDFKVEALQVRDVSRNVEREDLPPPALQHFVAAGEALKDQAALGWAVAIPNDVVIFPNVPHSHGQSDNCLPLFVREGRHAFEFHDKRM